MEILPTREQIEAITDLDALNDLLDEVIRSAEHIKADLEFRSDDGATDDWERRARGALAAHNIVRGILNKQIHFVRKGGKQSPPQADPNAKARKHEAVAARMKAEGEARKAKAILEREKAVAKMMEFSARQSLLLHFHRVAERHLDADLMRDLMAEARDSLEASLARELPPLEPTP